MRFCSLKCRFLSYVVITDGCWGWTGYCDDNGYAKLYANGIPSIASRVSWEVHVGPIPKGMFICHICDKPNLHEPQTSLRW